MIIGIVVLLEVIGYYTRSKIFFGVFLLAYLFCTLLFIMKIFLEKKKFSEVFECKAYRNWSLENCLEWSSWKRKLPCIIVMIINIFMAGFFGWKYKPGISRYLLAILMLNMVLYCSYYVMRKLHLRLRKNGWRENEGITSTGLYRSFSLLDFGWVWFN